MINIKHIFSIIILPSLLLITVACETTVAQNTDSESPKEISIVKCTEPRPQICTNEYKPVCATLKNTKKETYATGCTACADKYVISYIQNVCEKVEK